MSESEPVPDLCLMLKTTSTHMLAISAQQQERLHNQHLRIVLRCSSLARFSESFKTATGQHAEALEQLNEAAVRELSAQQRVSSLTSQIQINIANGAVSSSNQETAERVELENQLNEAKLQLFDAESFTEFKKQEEESIITTLRTETTRIRQFESQQLMVLTNILMFGSYFSHYFCNVF